MPRPGYSIPTGNFKRPSTVPVELQATAVYRLRRLQSLVNIYHWALEWIVHSASYWTLGQEAYDFRFDQVDLWLHGIETVDDVWNLRNSIESIVAQKRDDITVVQAFGADEVQFARDANGEVGVDGAHQFTAEFLSPADAPRRLQGNDLITSVTFSSPELDSDKESDRRERVPFQPISTALRRGSIQTEELFTQLGINWPSPPLFLGFENGAGLLVHMRAKGIDAESLLADLEQHRLGRVADIERALREAWAFESDRISPDAKGAAVARDPLIDARDKWLYEFACEGVAWKSILARLKVTAKQHNWPMLNSEEGVRAAVRRYCKRHQCAAPRARKAGRPSRRNTSA